MDQEIPKGQETQRVVPVDVETVEEVERQVQIEDFVQKPDQEVVGVAQEKGYEETFFPTCSSHMSSLGQKI